MTTPIKIFTNGLIPEEGGDACGGGTYAAGGTAAVGGGTPAAAGRAAAGGTPLGCETSPTRVPHVTQNACPSPNAVPQFLQNPAIEISLGLSVEVA